ncbi:MAG: hydrogenase nickel incorporation protein HypB [Thermoplasmata archaeon]|nr:hydrogenase nickel incorporation protein HypB [Thermoplasmata archaeon]
MDLLAANKKLADANRALLDKHGVRAGAIAGDVAGDDDHRRFLSHSVPAVNMNTDKECHLDAHLVDHALGKLPLDELDVLFIENVGNLVCPADFPLGAEKRMVVISVTEGDDMVRKHPIIFGQSDVIVVNKLDLADVVEVDPRIILKDAKRIAPHTPVMLTDAKHGEGLEELLSCLGL